MGIGRSRAATVPDDIPPEGSLADYERNAPPGQIMYYATPYSNGSTPLLRRSPANSLIDQESNNRCRTVSRILLLVRCSYLTILLIKLFLKFVLIPWLFFHKKPYGDLDNVSLETVTIFLWLVLIYMTIFVIIGIIGILDDNLYLISCFLFLMDMEVIICLYNGYIDSSTRTVTLSVSVVTLTSVYMALVLLERKMLRAHRHEHPIAAI